MPNLSHFIEGFALKKGKPIVQEFEDLLSLGVEPIIYGQDAGGPSLEDLANQGLLPEQKIEFGDVTYFMSKIVEAEDRPAFIYYLSRTNDSGKKEIFVHSAYKSNSQNEWRTISHTTAAKDWFGKGLGELTTGFPFEIADLIEKAYSDGQETGLEKIDMDIYLGIPNAPNEENTGLTLEPFVRSIPILSKEEIWKQRTTTGTDPEQRTTIQAGEFPDKIASFATGKPDSLVFEEGYSPNLNYCFKTFETQNPIYGKVTSYYFLSDNLRLQYSFHIDEQERSWIGAAQVIDPKVTRFGVKNIKLLYDKISSQNDRVHMDLFAPAFEYRQQILPEFLGGKSENNSGYYDATAFTHKIPIVAEFRKRAMEGLLKTSPIEEILAPDSDDISPELQPERYYPFGENYSSAHIIPPTTEMDDAFRVYLNRDRLAGHLDCIIRSQLSGKGRLSDDDVSYLVGEFQNHVAVFDSTKAQLVYNKLTEGFSRLVT